MLVSSTFSFINISIIIAVLGLGIYTTVLFIKALKIYIKKNS